MEKFIIITSREYLNKITNKTFILSTLFIPFILVGIGLLIGWFANINNEQVNNVSVVDKSGYIFDNLKSTSSINYTQLENFDLEEAKLISKTKSDFGLLYIDNFESPRDIAESISFYSEDTPSLTVIGNIESQLENILTNKNYKIQGIDINKINSNKIYVSLYQETFQGKKTTKSDSAVGLIFGLFLAFLLYMLIFAYGGMIMASVIEEKSSRIIEVIVSSVKPFYLISGKIVGTSLAGISQFIVWAILFYGSSFLISTTFGITSTYENNEFILTAEDSAISGFVLEMLSSFFNLPLLNIFVAFIFYFIGGYLLYSSLFAAVGAAVDNQTDAQQFMLPITLIVIIALYVGIFTAENPDGIISVIFSMIPLTSPIVMMMRIPSGVPILDQIVSILILFLSVILIIWMAAKIYRIGILMYGKKPTYKDLIKWLKY
jgi:ABC-2 type transport system permease protein|tara:strand:+ start:483 stop:1781 length:1299 start_codon:yes stop_codon:yes gene_type:complete